MRRALAVVLVLLVMIYLACAVETPRSPSVSAGDPWRRTAEGWQRINSWTPRTIHRPELHPGLFAAFVLLAGLLPLLAAASESDDREESPASAHRGPTAAQHTHRADRRSGRAFWRTHFHLLTGPVW